MLGTTARVIAAAAEGADEDDAGAKPIWGCGIEVNNGADDREVDG